MAQSTPEEEAALNEVMQLLKAQTVESTSANSLVTFTNDDQTPPLNVRNWQFWFD